MDGMQNVHTNPQTSNVCWALLAPGQPARKDPRFHLNCIQTGSKEGKLEWVKVSVRKKKREGWGGEGSGG